MKFIEFGFIRLMGAITGLILIGINMFAEGADMYWIVGTLMVWGYIYTEKV